MRILIACEFSGICRRAFENRGHDSWSCDLLESEQPSPKHVIGDVRDLLAEDWDMMIGFPPCTYLAASGARWWAERETEQDDAVKFFMQLITAPIEKIAIENPVGVMSSRYRPPDQYIHPWMFGHCESKKTGLWLKNLPLLSPTDIVQDREPVCHYMPPGPDRWRERSRILGGIAAAMAAQWG